MGCLTKGYEDVEEGLPSLPAEWGCKRQRAEAECISYLLLQ